MARCCPMKSSFQGRGWVGCLPQAMLLRRNAEPSGRVFMGNSSTGPHYTNFRSSAIQTHSIIKKTAPKGKIPSGLLLFLIYVCVFCLHSACIATAARKQKRYLQNVTLRWFRRCRRSRPHCPRRFPVWGQVPFRDTEPDPYLRKSSCR